MRLWLFAFLFLSVPLQGETVYISFEAVPEFQVTHYRIYRSSVSGGPYTLVGMSFAHPSPLPEIVTRPAGDFFYRMQGLEGFAVSGTSINHAEPAFIDIVDLSQGEQFYVVAAVNRAGESPFTQEKSAKELLLPPPAPEGLSVVVQEDP